MFFPLFYAERIQTSLKENWVGWATYIFSGVPSDTSKSDGHSCHHIFSDLWTSRSLKNFHFAEIFGLAIPVSSSGKLYESRIIFPSVACMQMNFKLLTRIILIKTHIFVISFRFCFFWWNMHKIKLKMKWIFAVWFLRHV